MFGLARLPEVRQVAAQHEHVRYAGDFREHLAVGRAVLLHVEVADRRHAQLAALLAILLFEIPDGFGKAPLLDVDRIVARREDAPAADLLARAFHVILIAQALHQLVHDPAGTRCRSLG